MEKNLYINLQVRKRRKSKRRRFKFLVLSIVTVLLIYTVFSKSINSMTGKQVELVKPSFTILPLGESPDYDVLETNDPLGLVIKDALSGAKGMYGIVVKNLETKKVFVVNEHRVFKAGSLYKLWVMATVVNKLQAGEWKEDQVLSEDISVLNNKFEIDPELAEQTEGTITLSVRDALKQMITISHNYAALLLTENVKLSSVVKFLESNGFSESKVGVNGEDPTTTPADIALFFEKLYKGELADKQNTDLMIDLLTKQKLNNKLPRYLPKGTIMAHKTGELGWFSHDAGIVYSPKGDYIIVVLSESDLPAGAEDRIAQISKGVNEYFSKSK